MTQPEVGNAMRKSLTIEIAQRSLDDQFMLDEMLQREEIRKVQKKEADLVKSEQQKLIRQSLPKYVFAVNPAIKRFPKDPQKAKAAGVPPTIIEQEVARAQASAELNVYLSYITKNHKKAEFLQKWAKVSEINTGEGSSKQLMEQLQNHLWKQHGQMKHADNHKKKSGKPFYYVHDLDPLPRRGKNPGTTPASAVGSRHGSMVEGMTNAPSSLFANVKYQSDSSAKTSPDKSVFSDGSAKSASPKSISPKDKKVGVKRNE